MKQQQKAKNAWCVLLGLVLVITGVWATIHFQKRPNTALSGSALQTSDFKADETEKSALQPICSSLNLPAEIINAEQTGSVLKLDYIQPGLDTYDLTVVLYSLTENKILLQKSFGTGDFATGQTNDGFYVASMKNKTIDFYNNSGKALQTVQLPGTAEAGGLCVSKDKSYACLVDGRAAQILVYSLAEKQVTARCNKSGYLNFVGEQSNTFYLQCEGNNFMQVDARAGTFHTTAYKSNVRAFTEYGCFLESETGFLFSGAVELRKEETAVSVNLIDEVPLGGNREFLLTLTGNSSEKLTVYNLKNSKNVCFSGPSNIRQAVPLENGLVFFTAGQTQQTPYLLQTGRLRFQQGRVRAEVQEQSNVSSLASVVPESGGKLLSGVPVISQFPNYPTGCESVSAVIAVRAAGDKLSVKSFVTNYLKKSSSFYLQDGKKFGPDPREYFIGTPTSQNAYGCMAPVIEAALNKFYNGKKTVVNATGSTLEQLCERFVNHGTPCIVWASINMAEPYYSSIWHLENGESYTWLANEHCLVLMGYDSKCYYFSDPYKGAVVKFEKALCQSRYKAFGQQALAIQ